MWKWYFTFRLVSNSYFISSLALLWLRDKIPICHCLWLMFASCKTNPCFVVCCEYCLLWHTDSGVYTVVNHEFFIVSYSKNGLTGGKTHQWDFFSGLHLTKVGKKCISFLLWVYVRFFKLLDAFDAETFNLTRLSILQRVSVDIACGICYKPIS